MTDLSPCSRCNGEPVYREDIAVFGPPCPTYIIQCRVCRLQVQSVESRAQAVQMWNWRPETTDDLLRVLIEEVRRLGQQMQGTRDASQGVEYQTKMLRRHGHG
jgi:hypothetical protein